jgi:hypothetical protein
LHQIENLCAQEQSLIQAVSLNHSHRLQVSKAYEDETLSGIRQDCSLFQLLEWKKGSVEAKP